MNSLVSTINELYDNKEIWREAFITGANDHFNLSIPENTKLDKIADYLNDIQEVPEKYYSYALRNEYYEWQYFEDEDPDFFNLPYDFGSVYAFIYDNKLHIMAHGQSMNDRKKYFVWDGTTWEDQGTLPTDFYSSRPFVYKDKICYFENYYWYTMEPSTKVWTRSVKYNFRCSLSYPIIYKDKLHIFGGRYSQTVHRIYDDDTDTWIVQDEAIPFKCYQTHPVIFNGKIHLIGQHDSGTYVHWSWNEEDGYIQETTKENFPCNFYRGYVTVEDDGYIHMWEGSANPNAHYIYDGTAWYEATWNIPSMPQYNSPTKTYDPSGYPIKYNGSYYLLQKYGTYRRPCKLKVLRTADYNQIVVKKIDKIYYETTIPTVSSGELIANDDGSVSPTENYVTLNYMIDEYLTVMTDKITQFIHPNKNNECYIGKDTYVNDQLYTSPGVYDYTTL